MPLYFSLVWSGFSVFIFLDLEQFWRVQAIILFPSLGAFDASLWLDSGCGFLAAVRMLSHLVFTFLFSSSALKDSCDLIEPTQVIPSN